MKEKYLELQKCRTFKEIVSLLGSGFYEKIAFYCILIYCLLPNFILLTNIFIKGSSIMYFYISLFLFGGIGLLNGIIYFLKKYYDKKITKRDLIPFGIIIFFLLWCLISCLLSENKNFAFFGTNYRRDGYISYILYFGFFINGLIVSHNKKYLKNILNCFLISSSVMALLIFMNNDITKILLLKSNYYHNHLYTGIFSQFNHYGYYLTISICAAFSCFLFSKKKLGNIIYILDYILLLYVLIKNDTFGCYLSVCFSIICLVIYCLIVKKNRLKSLLIVLVLLVLSINFNTIKNNLLQTSNEIIDVSKNINDIEKLPIEEQKKILSAGTGRLDLWINGIKFIGDKPIFGYGLENLEKPYLKSLRYGATDRPHNMFIQIGANTGIMGLLSYISFLFITFISILKKLKNIDQYILCFVFICIGYISSSMFGNSMFYTTPYYMISLGIILSVYFKQKNIKN